MSNKKIIKGIWKVKNEFSKIMIEAEARSPKDISDFFSHFAKEGRNSTFEFVFLGERNSEKRIRIIKRNGQLFLEAD